MREGKARRSAGGPPPRIRRRDRHGRGLRGPLAPADLPLHRSRAEQFDDLVLQAVAQLEPRWESELAGIEFAVEEVPPAIPGAADGELVPLARTEPAMIIGPVPGLEAGSGSEAVAGDQLASPPRIVLYRRPLMARAEGDEELGELVLDVVVEEFARLIGVDPETVDPGSGAGA